MPRMDAHPRRLGALNRMTPLRAALTAGVATAGTAALVFAMQSAAQDEQPGARSAKNVIFLMGDGMGPAERTAIRYANAGLDGQLVMDSLGRPGKRARRRAL